MLHNTFYEGDNVCHLFFPGPKEEMDVSEKEKPLVKDLNEHIICPLCRGYFVDATTLVECLHSC